MIKKIKLPKELIPTEHQEQVALMEFCESMTGVYPELRMLYAIPNGGKRSIGLAVKLKKEGVKSGVPDLCLPVPKKGYHGLYIEMKKVKDGKMTDAQKWWHEELFKQGYLSVVCYGMAAAKNVIMEYLK